MVDHIEDVLENVKRAGAEPLSETHGNSTYEDSEGSKSVYVKAPFNALIELQSIPNGYYYQMIVKQMYLFLVSKI